MHLAVGHTGGFGLVFVVNNASTAKRHLKPAVHISSSCYQSWSFVHDEDISILLIMDDNTTNKM